MKGKFALIILTVFSIGLLIALVVNNKQAAEEKVQNAARMIAFSNQWQETSAALVDQKQVITNLVELKASQEEVAKRDARIAELEMQNQTLEQKAAELQAAITNLNGRIEDTKAKLAATEGDKTFLEGELQKMLAEKAALEAKFNDISAVRTQVKKLKTEAAVERRLDWVRRGISTSEKKGALKQMKKTELPPSQPKPRPDLNLNVEINSDGSVTVLPPLTNAPAK